MMHTISIRKIWLTLAHKTNINLENKQKSVEGGSISDFFIIK